MSTRSKPDKPKCPLFPDADLPKIDPPSVRESLAKTPLRERLEAWRKRQAAKLEQKRRGNAPPD